MIYIVTRHKGAIEWLRTKGYSGEVIPHLDNNKITGGNLYIGVVPVPIIKQILDAGSRFFLLALPDIAFSQRGQDMIPDEMEGAGARLIEVKRIELAPVETG
jgi:CRISPR-associated protein Csx16